MIAFKQDTQLSVVIRFDEAADEIAEQAEETFKKGELVDAEVYNTYGKYADIQYADGTVSTGVLRSSFVVKREKKKKA
jgi:hypothetical protein